MKSEPQLDRDFIYFPSTDSDGSSLAAARFIGTTLLFIGASGVAVSLALFALDLTLAMMELPDRGVPLPFPPLLTLLGVLLFAGLVVCGTWQLLNPATGWSVHRTLAVLIRSAGVIGAALSVASTAIAFTWNRFGTLATAPIPLWIPLLALAVSLGLVAIIADAPHRRYDLRRFVVGAAFRMLSYVGYVVLALSLLLFPATLGLAMIGFADVEIFIPLAGAVIGPVLVVFGLLVASPRKQLILFLRRFGNEDINRAVRRAIRGRLGATHRLIALDDLSFVAASSPPGPKIITAATIALTATSALLAARSLASSVWTFDQEPGELDGMEVWYIQMFLDGAARGATLVILYVVGLSLITGFAILILGRRSRLHIKSDVDIRRVERQARRLASWWRRPLLFAPQATVVKVAYSLWQPTVLALLRDVDIILLDLSVPTDSLLWELRAVQSNASVRPVLLAQIDRLKGWLAKSGDRESLLFDTFLAARGLPLVTYSAPRLLDVETLALAIGSGESSSLDNLVPSSTLR